MSLVELRRKLSRKRRKFVRQEQNKYKKLKSKWRKPYGNQSKLRMHSGEMRTVEVGFRGPAAVRGFHPSGVEEVLVHNLRDLDGLKGKVVRIAAGVGKKKRLTIIEKATKLKLRVLNPGRAKPKQKKGEKDESKTSKKASK